MNPARLGLSHEVLGFADLERPRWTLDTLPIDLAVASSHLTTGILRMPPVRGVTRSCIVAATSSSIGQRGC